MSAVRVLGACGLLSAFLSMFGGFTDAPALIGFAGLVMVAGNLYAMVRSS